MNKLAIFVEGYTEMVFADRLVSEIASGNDIRIEWQKIRGGTTQRRTMALIKRAPPDAGQLYYVLIVDCGSDDSVKSRIREEYENLVKAGYKKIVGLRDVRPKFAKAEIPKLERLLNYKVKTNPIQVDFILAIMETEAWFLAEHTHLMKINAKLTPAFIQANLGFDPSVDDMENRHEPAVDLNNAYNLVGLAYKKHRCEITIKAMDFARVYIELPNRYGYLGKLVSAIDSVLS